MENILLSRASKLIYAQKWFTKDYPLFPIDGELWSNSKLFLNILEACRNNFMFKAECLIFNEKKTS